MYVSEYIHIAVWKYRHIYIFCALSGESQYLGPYAVRKWLAHIICRCLSLLNYIPLLSSEQTLLLLDGIPLGPFGPLQSYEI